MKVLSSTSAIALAGVLSTSPIMASGYLSVNNADGTNAFSDIWRGEDVISEDGTWSWTDGGDYLNLNNYNGGNIVTGSANDTEGNYVDGDITVNVSGDNTVTADTSCGIIDYNGDLTINSTDDGTLTVNSTRSPGIYNSGDVNIEDVNLNINSAYYGIFTYPGNVNIDNSNVVINVENGRGIQVYNNDDEIAQINITKSNVKVDADDYAMYVNGGNTEETSGQINIVDSKIVLPEGAKVIKVMHEYHIFVDGEEVVKYASDATIGQEDFCVTYMTAEELEAAFATIATSVTIEAVEDEEEATPQRRAAVDTGISSDMSLYLAGAVVAVCVAGLASKKKH